MSSCTVCIVTGVHEEEHNSHKHSMLYFAEIASQLDVAAEEVGRGRASFRSCDTIPEWSLLIARVYTAHSRSHA